ncbi:MAG: hypothetical protein HYR76_04430 [Ignavibacteria bacterium]|nr:hypothetical protein [Ignavibacteria bacterium]
MKNLSVMFFTMLIVVSLTSFGQVPQKISYQGLLTTGAGSPIADGNYDLKFEIFNLPSLGTLRHTETQTGVVVQRGTFSVILGSVTPFAMSFNESLYVQVTVVAGPPGPSYPITFSPRSELTSAPYALSVATIDGASGGTIELTPLRRTVRMVKLGGKENCGYGSTAIYKGIEDRSCPRGRVWVTIG